MQKQQGFTLIELIVVIVILGILAATAMPRFAGLERDARFAAAKGILGSVQSGSALAHAAWLVQGASGTSVTMEGLAVTLANGYPDTTATTGIERAAGLVDGQGYTITAGNPLTVKPDGAPATCQVSYTASSGTNIAPTITLNATTSADCG